MKFIDQIKFTAIAGKGGAGIISFMNSKGRANLGPDGGDGGNGGNVILVGTESYNTFSHLDRNRTYKAEAGASGGVNGRTGARGEDKIIKVPLGTKIFDSESKALLGEITKVDEKVEIAKGGKHGWGNIRFKSSVTRAPYKLSLIHI